MATILIPDRVASLAADMLRAAGHEVMAPGRLGRAQTLAAIPRAHALIIRSATQVDAEMLRAARELRFVIRAGAGVDNIDLAAATERGVVVMNTPGANTLAVAEFTLGLLLALARHIPQAHASLKSGEWQRQRYNGVTLAGKTLGLFGFGRIGRALAARARPFGMRVIAHDPFVPAADFAELGAESVPLAQLWVEADFISLHAEVNEATRGIIDAESIAQMKDGARIINTARGPLIDATALAAALRSGKIGGAAIDVYEQEPPPAGHPLIGLPGVIHTPHLAASAVEIQEAVAREAAETLLAALAGEGCRNVCNPRALERASG